MAAAITITEKRETEMSGIFQHIISEMLSTNNIPEMRFLESVVKDYKQKEKQDTESKEKEKERKKEEKVL